MSEEQAPAATEAEPYSIGPGVRSAMADFNDEPRSDELYIVNTDGKKVSQTYGRDAIYVWYEEDNATRRSPFQG